MTKHKIYSAIVTFILLTISFGFTIVWVSNVDNRREKAERKQDRVWCDLLVALDERNRTIPNPNPDQVEFFNLIADIRKGYGCD